MYAFEYTYDQLGDRTVKLDTVHNWRTEYRYDTDLDPNDPNSYPDPRYVTRTLDRAATRQGQALDNATPCQGRANRLLYYKEYNAQTGGDLVRTMSYQYLANGNPGHIIVKDEYPGSGDPNEYTKYYALRLAYASNRRLWLAVNETWRKNEQGEFVDYTVNGAWEFRYDGDGRERYMARQWTTPDPNYVSWRPAATVQWTDYRGSAPYGDYAVEIDANQTAVVTEMSRFLFGQGAHGQETLGESGSTVFLHGDLIGSTMLTVNAAGQVVETPVYTAFGEPVTGSGVGVPPANPATRYGYAGAWGYESGLLTLQGANTSLPPITLQHVGERWYQPGIGRFVQRDPIGIRGGLNVYAYCQLLPITGIDPSGLSGSMPGWVKGIAAIVVAVAGVTLAPAGSVLGLGAGIGGVVLGWDEIGDLGVTCVRALSPGGLPPGESTPQWGLGLERRGGGMRMHGEDRPEEEPPWIFRNWNGEDK